MKAKIEGNPSYMWRNIIATKELVKQGTMWRVGNGDAIKIWEDIWLTSSSTFQVQSPTTILFKEAQVSELFYRGRVQMECESYQPNFLG